MTITFDPSCFPGVLVHPLWGAYLGECLGLGFWSNLDPVGQPAALVFHTQADVTVLLEQALNIIATATHDGFCYLQLIKVVPDQDPWASIAACTAAGIPAWNPDGDKIHRCLINKTIVELQNEPTLPELIYLANLQGESV